MEHRVSIYDVRPVEGRVDALDRYAAELQVSFAFAQGGGTEDRGRTCGAGVARVRQATSASWTASRCVVSPAGLVAGLAMI